MVLVIKPDDLTPPSSTISTSAPTAAPMPTPSTPQVPAKKLPLAIRKEIRDHWECKQPSLEAELTTLLGTPWKIAIDVAHVYSLADDGYAKESPGAMFVEYFEGAIFDIKEFLQKHGEEGKTELNAVASSHTITIEETTKPEISFSGCEISGGCLRLLFPSKQLGSNVSDTAKYLENAVNQAGKTTSATAGGLIPLDFHAKSSIRIHWDSKVLELQQRIQKLLNLPVLTLNPCFENNYSKMAAFASTETTYDLPDDWDSRLGEFTCEYFEGLAWRLKDFGFENDEMLQEGFAEAVEKNEVGLRVVDKLQKEGYNECVLENGVLWMQTTPGNWTANIQDAAKNLMDVL